MFIFGVLPSLGKGVSLMKRGSFKCGLVLQQLPYVTAQTLLNLLRCLTANQSSPTSASYDGYYNTWKVTFFKILVSLHNHRSCKKAKGFTILPLSLYFTGFEWVSEDPFVTGKKEKLCGHHCYALKEVFCQLI